MRSSNIWDHCCLGMVHGWIVTGNIVMDLSLWAQVVQAATNLVYLLPCWAIRSSSWCLVYGLQFVWVTSETLTMYPLQCVDMLGGRDKKVSFKDFVSLTLAAVPVTQWHNELGLQRNEADLGSLISPVCGESCSLVDLVEAYVVIHLVNSCSFHILWGTVTVGRKGTEYGV